MSPSSATYVCPVQCTPAHHIHVSPTKSRITTRVWADAPAQGLIQPARRSETRQGWAWRGRCRRSDRGGCASPYGCQAAPFTASQQGTRATDAVSETMAAVWHRLSFRPWPTTHVRQRHAPRAGVFVVDVNQVPHRDQAHASIGERLRYGPRRVREIVRRVGVPASLLSFGVITTPLDCLPELHLVHPQVRVEYLRQFQPCVSP